MSNKPWLPPLPMSNKSRSKASLQFEKDRAGNHDALSSIYDIILQASEASGSPRVRRDDVGGGGIMMMGCSLNDDMFNNRAK